MVIYIDLLIILNFIYDLLILMTLSITLKRKVKFRQLLVGALYGGVSTLLILLNINNVVLFILEIISGLIMIIITFKFKNILYTLDNILYLYMISIILAGFLYFLKLQFTNANYILLLIIAPIILYVYINFLKKFKVNINYKRQVKIILKNNKCLELIGFIDSGNKLRDPITKKYIILINKKILKGIYNIRSPIYVAVNTINKKSLIECIPIKDLIIDENHYNNYLLGLTDYIKEDCECLLNYKLLEEK